MATENQALNLVGNLTLTDVARLCYNADYVIGGVPASGTGAAAAGGIGTGQFEQAPAERREIIIANVRKVLDTPTITPEQVHAHWIELMKAQGWSRGSATNVDRKQHALLVPYTELPQGDQIRPRLFITLVQALMESRVGKGEGTTVRTER